MNTLWRVGIAFAVCLVTGFILWGLLTARQERMVVRSMGWKYTIVELENYRVHECHPKTRRTCTGSGDNRHCRQTTYQKCDWETKTKTHNTWITEGSYPVAPVWENNYTIGQDHYERRYEEYTVMFSDDKKLYPYHPALYIEYIKYVPRQSHEVKLNFFGYIIGVVE